MILAGDPGKRCGLSLYSGGVLATSTIDGDDIDRIVLVMEAFAELSKGDGIVVVEDQYAAVHTNRTGRGQINVKSVIKLVERRTNLVAVARSFRLVTKLVKPSTWQGPAFKSVPRFNDYGAELDTKTRAGLFVQQRVMTVHRGSVPGAGGKSKAVPSQLLPKDEQDAAAIALYWATWRSGD
ncbi:MAG: hypothetical protein M0R28_17935 [Pigmentiphaga sp.]|nr:hypothetical protein [Pigmentiphaga sp.]